MDATVLKIDEAILESNKIICRQISRLGTSTRGEVSQEILESLRHFVEHILLKEYANGDDIEDTHDNIKTAVKFAKSQPQLIHISRFHHFLQVRAFSGFCFGSSSSISVIFSKDVTSKPIDHSFFGRTDKGNTMPCDRTPFIFIVFIL